LDNYSKGDTVWVSTLWGNPGVIHSKKESWSKKAVIIKKHGFIVGGMKSFVKYH
jgi:hypothetical protein